MRYGSGAATILELRYIDFGAAIAITVSIAIETIWCTQKHKVTSRLIPFHFKKTARTF